MGRFYSTFFRNDSTTKIHSKFFDNELKKSTNTNASNTDPTGLVMISLKGNGSLVE